jgi:acetylornithine deacetylase/succinyl-diaminopimelate desuccinylase-like protein
VSKHIQEKLSSAINIERLVDTAVKLIGIPSPTLSAKPAADKLAEILEEDGFNVERPNANWPESPAVFVSYDSGQPGKTLQFNGHLDTVHLPFVEPRVENGILYGSGASDMKGGVAAMCEALRILRDSGLFKFGKIILTAHDHHEAPWGDGRQVKALIDQGYVGDGVLIPEYLSHCLPVLGRGMAIFEVSIKREGIPVHEVQGGLEQPSVIAAGADLITRFRELDKQLTKLTHPLGARESIFIGQVSSGEIYNQSPTEFKLQGTRRWLPGNLRDYVEKQFQDILKEVGKEKGIQVKGEFNSLLDPYELNEDHPLLPAFQSAYEEIAGRSIPLGAKPFLDDGNNFIAKAGIPAITHGPDAIGAHTVNEEVSLDELKRVALIYALTAILFCDNEDG